VTDKEARYAPEEVMEENEEETVPGIEATRRWLAENNVAPYRFAIDNDIDPAGFGRILKRKNGVSLETAVKIERGTKGAVTADMFVLKGKEGS